MKTMTVWMVTVLLAGLTPTAWAQFGGVRVVAREVASGDPVTAGYNTLLGECVDADGWVDYDRLTSRGQHDLKEFVKAQASVDLEMMDDDQKLAQLINAYNAFTLLLIVEHYDGGKLKSITDLSEGKPWDQKRWRLAGRTVSLNQIEHEMIRPVFKEPRIHWALVCAAYSCPPLRNEAYTADKLEEQLDAQEDYVLNFDHERYAKFTTGKVEVTRLFEWYGQDFGDWKVYLSQRLPVPSDASFGFLTYDWRLNSKANKPG